MSNCNYCGQTTAHNAKFHNNVCQNKFNDSLKVVSGLVFGKVIRFGVHRKVRFCNECGNELNAEYALVFCPDCLKRKKDNNQIVFEEKFKKSVLDLRVSVRPKKRFNRFLKRGAF